MSITAFLLSLPGCCFGIPSLILGILVLRKSKATGQDHGRAFAWVAVVASLFWMVVSPLAFVYVESSQVGRDEAGTVAESGAAGVQDLRVGDCLRDLEKVDVVFSVNAVPCAQPHNGEVFAVFDLAAGVFPGEPEVSRLSGEGCGARLTDYVGGPVDGAGLEVFYLHPVEVTWELERGRSVTCIALTAEDVTGSVKGTKQ